MQDVNFWRLHGFFISFGAMNEAQWQKGKICSRKLFACTDNTVCRIHFFPTASLSLYLLRVSHLLQVLLCTLCQSPQ